jgi:hypothetical protein
MTVPSFGWNPVVGADHYQVELTDLTTGQHPMFDNNSDVTGNSWTPTIPLAQGHAYRWWVRAIDSLGNSSLGSTALRFTIARLGAPTLISPKGTLAPTDTTPIFTWQTVAGADHYDILVADLSSGVTARETNVAGNTWTFGTQLNPGDAMRWWVRAIGPGGQAGPWSRSFDFSIALLATPSLIGPHGPRAGATPSFSWNSVAGADHYEIAVDDLTSGKKAVLHDTSITATSWVAPAPLSPGHKYRWRVRALGPSGSASAWSAPLAFSI